MPFPIFAIRASKTEELGVTSTWEASIEKATRLFLNPHKMRREKFITYLISRGVSEARAHIQDCVSKPPNGSTDNIQFPGDMCPSEKNRHKMGKQREK